MTTNFSKLFAVVTEKKPKAQARGAAVDPKAKFLSSLVKDKTLAEAYAAGQNPAAEEGKRVRRNFWEKGGVFYISLAYGTEPLDLDGKGNNTIKAGKGYQAVVDTYAALINSIKSGDDLDDVIIAASVKVSTRMRAARAKI